MKVLIIGNGGRESAIAKNYQKIKESVKCFLQKAMLQQKI